MEEAPAAVATDFRRFYDENGYVVVPGLVASDLCDEAMECFRREIKPYKGHLYRQASALAERHLFDSAGSVLNSILNPVSVNGRQFPAFRAVSSTVLSQDPLFAAVEQIYGEPAILVQSMYFEGNPATWPHQDCYYLDDDSPGRLMGAWIALEDIEEGAGRFYVAPGSHLLEPPRNAGDMCIAEHHDRYKQLIESMIASGSVSLHAPSLEKGDVLFWNSQTIHGAFPSSDNRLTRNSYTAHFIPSTSQFMQYQCIPLQLRPDRSTGRAICRPKDQNLLLNRWMLTIESHAPRVLPKLKWWAISWKSERAQRSCR